MTSTPYVSRRRRKRQRKSTTPTTAPFFPLPAQVMLFVFLINTKG